MRLFPHLFNGFYFQQNNKVATGFQNPYDWDISGISASDIARSQNFPLFASKNYTGTLKVLNIELLDVDMSRDDLVIAMDVLGDQQQQLIALDEFGRAWYVNAVFVGLTEDTNEKKTASFGAVFAIDDPIWKKVIASTASIETDLYGSASITLSPIGNQPALPVIKITPLGAGSGTGFSYQRFITIINNGPNALVNYPLDITGGGIDTAALIAGGKMLANGNDFRIYVDGVDVKRWFGGGGLNDANTLCFINWNQPANSNMTLGEVIAGTGDITYVQIQNNAANIALFPTIPNSGRVKIGNEIFVYTAKNAGTLRLTGITRAERQTSEEAHAIGDTVYFVTHDVWLYYGNPTIASYVVDDTYKPIIDLGISTNTSHAYTDEFYTLDGKRTAQWKKITYIPGINSRHYTATQNTLANPASVIGCWNKQASRISWRLYNPCGFVEITELTGKKRTANGTYSFDMLWAMYDLTSLGEIFAESIPTVGAGWVSLDTHTSIVVPPIDVDPFYKAYYLEMLCLGFTGPTGTNENGTEIDGIILEIDPDTAPTVNLAAEAGNFDLDTVLSNAATGYSLEIILSMVEDTYMIVDTKRKKVTLYDGSNQIAAIQDFPVRKDWFPLLADQENVITIADNGLVRYEFSYEDRYI